MKLKDFCFIYNSHSRDASRNLYRRSHIREI